MLNSSLYADSFARDRLPPTALWPELLLGDLMDVVPRHFNAAAFILERALAKGYGARPAIRFAGGCWTYAELCDRAGRIAHVLKHDLGLESGNRVLLRGTNTPMLAACWFGVVLAGGIAVTTMPLLRARELGEIIAKAQISHALCDAALAGEVETGGCLRQLCLFNSNESDGLEARMTRHDDDFDPVIASQDDVALIAFTSGTTGTPKATAHFHRDLIAICRVVADHVLQLTPDDIVTGSAPLGFTYGLGSLLLFPLWRGASTVLLQRATPETMLDTIRTHQATVLLTGPTLYRTMLAMMQRADIASLKACFSSGEHLPAAIGHAWTQASGLSIANILGATEMLHAFVATDSNPKAGSLGRALPFYEAKVVDEAMGQVAAGVIGRLAVRGPTGCRYLDDEARQKAYVREGWNLTGDAFSQDEEGVLWYHARTDDMIISSGYNISGAEIENVLLEHAAVSACAVIGVPDEARGAIAKAFVVLKQPENASEALALELQNHVKNLLAPYKYLRAIAFLEALPMTTTGKIRRAALREVADGLIISNIK